MIKIILFHKSYLSLKSKKNMLRIKNQKIVVDGSLYATITDRGFSVTRFDYTGA